MIKFVLTYLTITVCCIVQRVNSRITHVPQIACPQYFQYLCYGDNVDCFGVITISHVNNYGSTDVRAKFSQKSPVEGNFNMTFYQDEGTTYNNIENGKPVYYRVDFPMPNILPKLTEISINGRVVCSDSQYPAPSVVVTVNLRVFYPEQTISTPLKYLSNPFLKNKTPVQSITIKPILINQRSQPCTTVRPSSPPSSQPSSRPMSQPSIQPSTQANSQTVCGQEGEENLLVPFIAGGELLRPGQFPWLTAIFRKTDVWLFICGGSLISSRIVLSAGHCFKLTSLNAEDITVSLGRYNISKAGETSAVSLGVQTLLTNPEYDPIMMSDADVALLIMLKPVSFTAFIKPICLWTGSVDVNLVINETGYIAGWGSDTNRESVSSIPKIAPATIVSEAECRRSSDSFRTYLTSRTFCAGQRDGVGPCMGDSGAGLMIKRNGRWYLRGIVSVGRTENSRCNLREFVVYCDVAKHSTWVQSKLIQ